MEDPNAAADVRTGSVVWRFVLAEPNLKTPYRVGDPVPPLARPIALLKKDEFVIYS
jgi:hypothetical protein